jgi:hypothetical protein
VIPHSSCWSARGSWNVLAINAPGLTPSFSNEV